MADRKITDLTALTTPASADVLPIVDVSEAAAADKNKKITVGELFKGVPNGTAAAPAIAFESDDGNGIFLSTTDTVGIATNGSSRMTVSTTAVTSTLPVIVPDGTAAAPSVAFTGSGTDTGVYSPGVDQVAISTGGSGRLFVESTGRVGIGAAVSSLAAAQSVFGVKQGANTSKYQGLTIENSADDSQLALAYDGTSGTFSYSASYGTGGSYKPLSFWTSNEERLRITTDGKVGLGTSGPSANLESQGNVSSTTQFSGFQGLRIQNSNGSAFGVSADINFVAGTGTDNRGAVIGAIYESNAGGNDLYFATNGSAVTSNDTPTERMRITAAGNVGIGTTSVGAKLHVIGDSKNQLRLGTATSEQYEIGRDSSTGYLWFYGSQSGYTGYVFDGADGERARIDSSGRLLVGTSTARSNFYNSTASAGIQLEGSTTSRRLSIISDENQASGPATIILGLQKSGSVGGNTVVASGDMIGAVSFMGNDGSEFVEAATIIAHADGTPGANDMPGRLVFSTTADGASSPTERMRITEAGFTKSTNTGSYQGSTADYHESRNDEPDWIHYFSNTHASTPNGIIVRYTNTAPNDTGKNFFYAIDTVGVKFDVRSNGGIANYSGNNVNLCDEREKKNIEALDSTWSCLKNWDLKKFHYNEDADTDDKRYGVIAQQVASHCPEVITDWVKQKAEDAVLDEDGNVVTPAVEEVTRMGVKEQQMMWMAIKALQEAQTRIETLEAKVAALEAQ